MKKSVKQFLSLLVSVSMLLGIGITPAGAVSASADAGQTWDPAASDSAFSEANPLEQNTAAAESAPDEQQPSAAELPEEQEPPVAVTAENGPMVTANEITTVAKGTVVNLTEEGSGYWKYFSVGSSPKDNDKAWVSPLATIVEDSGNAKNTSDRIVSFRYADGADPQNNDSSYSTEQRGAIYQGVGNGMTLEVQGSAEERTLKLYFGNFSATLQVDVFLNDETTPLVTKEYVGGDPTAMPLFEMNYQTQPSDTLKVKATITAVSNEKWGSISLHALTISGDAANAQLHATTTKYSENSNTTTRDVNLTTEGNLDWLYIDGAVNTSTYDLKNQDTHAIQNVTLAKSYQVAENAAAIVSYTDGTNQPTVSGGRHMGVYKGASKDVLSFDVTGSTTGRTLRIYSGSWNSQIVLTVRVNGEQTYTETFGKNASESGGWSYVSEISYKTASDDDIVSVSLATSADTAGNMNLSAVTLYDGNYIPPEPDDPVYLRDISVMSDGTTVDLSKDGSGYWTYFSNRQSEKKDAEALAFLSDSVGGAGRATNDKNVHFKFSDGTGPESNSDTYMTEARGSIYEGVGSGFTFTLLPSTEQRNLNLYLGCYSSTYTVSVYQNGTLVGSKTHTGTATKFSKFSLRYQTAEADELTVQVTIDKVTDPEYGSISLQALTIDGATVAPDYTGEELSNDRVSMLHPKGNIKTLVFTDEQNQKVNIPFSSTIGNAGPSWQVDGSPLRLSKTADPQVYSLTRGGVEYKLAYSLEENGVVNVAATMTNGTDATFEPTRAGLTMGIDTYMMDRWADYENLFFPTLLRCEKNYLWGYFQSPNGHVLSVAVDAPVSSYRLNYQSGQHRIWTATLDFMQKDAVLPERHPQNNSTLAAGESRTWNLKLKLSDGVDSVKPDVESMIGAPMVEADRYTVGKGESAKIKVYSDVEISTIAVDKMDNANAPSLRTGNGESDALTTTYTPCAPLSLTANGDGTYAASFTPADGEGVYRLRVVGENGLQSEAMITLRNSWSWYMENAMEKAITHPARGGTHAESYYNAYSFYLGQKYFDLPETELAQQTDANYFRDVYDAMGYDSDWTPEVDPGRIQNTSTVIGQLVDRYEALGDITSLEDAVHLADFIIDKHQRADGAYVNGNADYTSVIYPAKSIMELMHAEKRLVDAGGDGADLWQTRYQKQYDSVKRSMDHLVQLKGDLDTEGQRTFEDGAFSCSATQLSEFALMHEPGSAERAKYQQSAEDYLRKHDALEQMLIPDSRMNGGSLRFWEAQYDTLVTASPNNMMNSPHGWSAWNIYGLFNLYELTGNTDYLERGMNAMGSCAQLMGFDGNLYWAFISDPYVPSSQFVQKAGDDSEFGTGERRNVTIGETYVDMITDWFRSPPGAQVGGYWGQGGSCDNDVHEIFKALDECVLTKGFVFENEDGSFTAYNCEAEKKDGKLVITAAADELTSIISLNLKRQTPYFITFSNEQTKQGSAAAGMSTVTTASTDAPLSGEKAITAFTIAGQAGESVIDSTAHTVSVTMPRGTDVTALAPTITVSEHATVSPASGAAQNFTSPVTYTVTAQDGTMQAYAVTVTVADAPFSSEKAITAFTIAGQAGESMIDSTAHTVSVTMPRGTDVTALAPTITVSEHATVSPASGAAQNFTSPVTYTVTAQDGTMQTYAVTVTLKKKPSDSGDSGSSGSSSSGGGSTTDNTTGTTTTVKNPDGSATETVTDKTTGAVAATTTYPDGTKIVSTTPKGGSATIEVTLPQGKTSATVTIPTTQQPKIGDVAVIIHADGTREVVKTSVSTADGLRVTLTENAKLEIIDNSKSFADVPASHWAADAVQFAASRELFNGTGNGFSPSGDMSRAMLFTVLARLDGQDLSGGENWYDKAMDWAKKSGISDGTNPNASITREALAAMLYRYAGSPDVGGMALGEFADAQSISSWASNAMLWCVDNGILNGNGGNLNPQATATRAEVSAMLMRFVTASK